MLVHENKVNHELVRKMNENMPVNKMLWNEVILFCEKVKGVIYSNCYVCAHNNCGRFENK